MHRRAVVEFHFDRGGVQGDDLAGHVSHLEMITDSVRRLTHRRSITFETGSPADFVAVDASSVREAIADQPPGRTVVHRGKVVADTRVETVVAD